MEYENFIVIDKIKNWWNRFFNFSCNIASKIEKNKLAFFASFFIIGIPILILNINTPLVLDDFAYSFNNEGSLLTGFSDIIKFQYVHYLGWGGRSVVHTIAQLLLFVHPFVADLLNTIAYLVYCYLIYYHIKGRGLHSLFLLILVFSLVFFLQPAFGETCLWITGSANYTWGTLIILLFLLPYRLYLNTSKNDNILKSFSMLLFGIIAGWTNENTAAALIVLVVLFIFFFKTQKYRIPIWAITGLIGCIAGYILMIAAPGNGVRVETLGLDTSFNILSIVKNFLFSTIDFIRLLGIFNLFGFVIILLYNYYPTDRNHKGNVFSLSLIYFLATLVCLYVMVFSPMFPTRSWFGIVTFNIIAFGIVIYYLDASIQLVKQLKTGIILFCFLFYAATYYEAYSDVVYMKHIWEERVIIIDQTKQSNEPVIFKIEKNKTRFTIEDTEFMGYHVSKYYGVNVDFE